MINVSDDFKQYIKSESRETNVRIYFNDSETPIAKENIISVNLTEFGMVSETIKIGDVCTNKIVINFLMPDNHIPLNNGKVKVEFGLLVNGDYEYANIGSYYIEEIVTNDYSNKIKITAYDSSYRFNNIYTPTITFPTDISNLLNDILEQTNISLKSTSLPHLEISGVLENQNYKVTLGYISALLGMNARINRDDELEFYWYQQSDVEINKNLQYISGFISRGNDITINSIKCTVEDNVLEIGSGTGMIISNPYMTQEILNSIFTKINGLTYTPCTVKWRGNPSLEIIDKVKIENVDGVYKNAILSEVQTSLVGLNSTIVSKGTSETEVVIKNNSPLKGYINKMYSTLKQSFKDSTETILGHNGGYYTVDVNDEGFPSGWTIMDTPTLRDDTKLWKWTAGGFGYSEDGGKTFTNVAIDMEGRINANVITTGTLQGDNFSLNLLTGEVIMGERDADNNFINVWFKADSTGMYINSGDGLNTDISEKLSNLDMTVEAIKTTVTEINNYSIIYNLNAEFSSGFDGWNFENGSLLPEANLLPSNDLLPEGYVTPTFLFKEYSNSLSKLGLYFFSDGYASTDLARVLVNDGTEYSFRCKREETKNRFTVYIIEYNLDSRLIKETMILDTIVANDYEEASIVLDVNTAYVSLKIQTYYDQPAGISELMFNRGEPRKYVVNPDDVYYYSKTSIEQLSDEIKLKVDKDGIISQINMTPEEIKILANKLALEGITTINGKVIIDLDGKIKGDEAEFTNAKFSGAISAASFTGTGDDSFINLGSGNFTVDGDGNMVSKSGGSMTVYGNGETTGAKLGIGILNGKIIFYRQDTATGKYNDWGNIDADAPPWIMGSDERTDLHPIYINGHWVVGGTLNSHTLRVQNHASIYGNAYATQFIPISDEKSKKDIKDIDVSKLIDIIKVKKYKLKTTEQDSVGVIAQDFKNTEFEELILIERPDGQLGVDYQVITMALVQRVQELSEVIEKLTKKEDK